VVSDGHTFYENRVYLKYETAYASNECGRVGSNYAGGYITLASSDVYSMSGYHYFLSMDAYKFNFADLNSMVPASAFTAMFDCDRGGASYQLGNGVTMTGFDKLNGDPVQGFCSIYIDSDYRPVLPVPPAMRALDPKWASCNLGLGGLFDPPIALQPASAAASATLPAGLAGQPTAAPASIPTSMRPATTVHWVNPVIPLTPETKTSVSPFQFTGLLPTLIQSIAPATVATDTPPKDSAPAADNLQRPAQDVPQDGAGDTASPTFKFDPSGTTAAAQIDSDPSVTTATTTLSQVVFTVTKGAQQQTITAIAGATGGGNSPVIIIGSKTLSAGGSAATIAGNTFTAAANGIVVNGQSTLQLTQATNLIIDSIVSTATLTQAILTLPTPNNQAGNNNKPPITAIATANASGSPIIVINKKTTLTPNGPPITLADGSVLQASTTITGTDPTAKQSPVLIINGTRTITLSATTSLVHKTSVKAIPTTASTTKTKSSTSSTKTTTSPSSIAATTAPTTVVPASILPTTTTTATTGGAPRLSPPFAWRW
jgi:hypothetical protein